MIQEKFIDGYDDKYSVNTSGEVFSYKGVNKRSIRLLFGTNSYYTVGLYNNGKQNKILAHRLVAQAFIPNPENKPCVNHKNGIKTDNRLENLEWASHSENHLHSFRELGRKGGRLGGKGYNPWLGKFGKDCHSSVPVIQLSMTGEFIAEFNCVVEAGKYTGVHSTHISSVCRGKRKSTGGFKWEYKNKIN